MVDIRTSCYAARLAAFSYPQKHWKALIFRGALKDGQAISLIPDDTLLTTQQAAEILNISRPYLYRMLDADEIPFIQVGTHRKLRLADVEVLRERRRNESRKALNAIAELNEDCDDYGDDYGETTRE
jgi:excisionase family DNA binding protein